MVCFIAATSLKQVLGYDDSLDAFGVHGIGGIVGALLTGVFVSKEISGVDGSFLIQLKGVAVTVIYGFAASFVILILIDKTIGLARRRGAGARGPGYFSAWGEHRVMRSAAGGELRIQRNKEVIIMMPPLEAA